MTTRDERGREICLLWKYKDEVRNEYFKACRLFTFFCIHKKKVLDSRKFSASGFRWIDIFWDVLNTIWPFLENVCLDTVSQELMRGNWWNLIFSWTFMGLRADSILVYIAQEVPMLFEFFDFFNTVV